MIQELLRGGGGLMEERKIAIPTALLLDGHSPSSTSITPPLSSSTTSSPSSAADNLKCPRCDSSNTKFCYYNNYNLTQPRHFCKTCRRYWTKGGALRNVPIGGGCRKSKSSGGSSIGATTGKIGGIKSKTNGFCDGMTTGIKPSFSEARGGDNGFGSHEFSHSPFLCTPPSHSSNLLSLLRDHTNPNPNPNPNLNFVRIKEDLSHLVPDATLVTNALNARLHGFDHNMGHVPISNPIIWKNDHYQQYHHHHQQQQQILQQSNNYNNNNYNNNNNNNNYNNNMLFGTEVQTTSGIQELYQRLRSTNNNYGDQQCQVILGNILGSSSSYSSSPLLPIPSSAAMTTATTITASTSTSHAPSAMDQIPISSSGQFGIGWNLPMTWSDHMPATSCGLEN